ncbi:uncharacterized protein CC84DRAFT_185113 [Paraphaeosphaeria sporulosa]|uniref:Uncharacterized protein n=1 Tax=Paraphaeosphaeria sporulosa TaxID=1460663 RepID=A0A177D116_9PLEO|nr:uncharacterized protein CC84DRAFT_185113 [Paraphaeosphaeria sporulosa]OAG13176.1 hypothetical protein CC84DRAFT_185113 [Paraphaeosphaeria sporulosa]
MARFVACVNGNRVKMDWKAMWYVWYVAIRFVMLRGCDVDVVFQVLDERSLTSWTTRARIIVTWTRDIGWHAQMLSP